MCAHTMYIKCYLSHPLAYISLYILTGGTYVALYPDNDITMVTADYGQSINISFFYATAENSPITLLRNGEDITQQAEFGQNPPVLPDHNQVRYYEVTLNASSAGLYILPNNGAGKLLFSVHGR